MNTLTSLDLAEISEFVVAIPEGPISRHTSLLLRCAVKDLVCLVDRLQSDLDEARALVRATNAAVKAYSEELNGEKTEHTYDAIVQRWKDEGRCICHHVIGRDKTRHFRECPMREEYPCAPSDASAPDEPTRP